MTPTASSAATSAAATALLSEAEVQALREAVTEAVLATPTGLREALENDPQASLRLVAATRTAAEESSRLLREAVTGARAAGHRWDTLGTLLGVSKQAAQQRFGTPTRPDRDGTADPGTTGTGGAGGAGGTAGTAGTGSAGTRERRVISPITSLEEMTVLAEEGRRGWHVVDYGTLFHVLEASETQWEHHRQPWTPGARRRLEAEGWTLIKTMVFPWGYYKRPLDLPPQR